MNKANAIPALSTATAKVLMLDEALKVMRTVHQKDCTSIDLVARLVVHALAAAEASHAALCKQYQTYFEVSPALTVSTAFYEWLGMTTDEVHERFPLQEHISQMLLGFVNGMMAAKNMQEALICTTENGPLLHTTSGVELLALGISEPGKA